MSKKLILAAALATLVLGAAHPAMAGDQNFTLDNQTGFKITALYVEPESNAKDWGDEMLKGAAIESGESQELKFTGYGDDCVFAISITDPAGTSWEVRNIDLCKINKVKFTKEGGKVVYAAE